MRDESYIERPPRLLPDIPHEEHLLPAPPQVDEHYTQSLIQIFLPSLTIIAFFAMAVFGQGTNLLFLLPMSVTVIASIALALYNRHRISQEKGQHRSRYARQLLELRKEMTVKHDIQRRFYLHSYPAPDVSLRIARDANATAVHGRETGRLGTRLWERRPSDPDFGTLRLGIGSIPSSVVYKAPRTEASSAPQLRDALHLAQDSQTLTGAPITVSMYYQSAEMQSSQHENRARHTIGIVGGDPRQLYEFLAAVLVHYCTFHSPDDARLSVLGVKEAWPSWRWLGRLPHSTSKRLHHALCFEDQEDRKGNREKSKVNDFLQNLRTTLDDRRMRLQDADDNTIVRLPFHLVIVDLMVALPPGSLLADLETEPAISMLLKEGAELGTAIVFLVPRAGLVPSGCQSVIELLPGAPIAQDGAASAARFRYAEVGLNGSRHAGQADAIANVETLTQFTNCLEPLKIRRSYGADLPQSVPLMDALGVETADEMRRDILANWKASQRPDQADWLQMVVGVLSGGDLRTLRLSAHADGVHGLIAGSTGSGKSELLMTMILGLAYKYDPSIVNFVLVDFKGGAAFEPLRKLPHVVDIVTNLKGSAVERMFAAIMAELHRREAINVATGSKHIVHYRRRGFHRPPYGQQLTVKGESYKTAPYPHLFVFVDEFAEMIAENPEYKAQLNSITRLGRALGITLILAAQRPTGVTDQMRANIKFRIALRVETREESLEVLRRPDAAHLPTGIPGRGYLQIGNENIELIQAAWAGSEYRGGVREEKSGIIWHGRPRQKSRTSEKDEYPKVHEMMVEVMAELAREHSLQQRKPWPDFLPERMSLQTPIDGDYINPSGLNFLLGEAQAGSLLSLNGNLSRWAGGEGNWAQVNWPRRAMRAVVGLVDNPYQSEQLPLIVDLRRGHAVVFGASGWGKTTFLRTLIVSLAANHSPHDLHIYILDFGGRQMSVFRDLPHVGAIITPDEEERVVRLLRQLDKTLERRKALLSDAGADDLYSYNYANPAKALPAILVAVDNFAEFRESFDSLLPMLVAIVREGRAYGIHFAVSAGTSGALTGKLYSLFTERLALKLHDIGEYVAVVGRGARDVDDVPGRGFVKIGRRPLEFQSALPIGVATETQEIDETQKLARLVRAFQEAGSGLAGGNCPRAISTLASRVLLRNLLSAATGSATGPGIRPVLGIDDLTLEPWLFDITRQGPHCLLIGPPNSGKTTALRSLVLSLATTYSPDEIMLVLADMQGRLVEYGGRYSLADLPHVIDVIDNGESVERLVQNLQTECAASTDNREKRRSILVIIDNYDSFAEDARTSRNALHDLAVLAREHGTGGLHFVLAGSPNITRSAEELRKQVQLPRFGIALQTAETAQMLNGRVPRDLLHSELPIGRGFVVRSGRTNMVQFATPYEDDELQDTILDRWVAETCARFPGRAARWGHEKQSSEATPVKEGGQKETAAYTEPVQDSTAGGARVDGQQALRRASKAAVRTGRLSAVPAGVDVEWIKERLKESGFTSTILASLTAVEIVNVAIEARILSRDDL